MTPSAVECGATINTVNNLLLTPLTVAAYLAKRDMFFHIANIEREVYWQIGNVCCSAYPIEQLDTINSATGELNTQSALNLIVFGKRIEHLDLIEGVVVDLLKTKWKTFIKQNFYRKFFIFSIYFLISSFCFITRPWLPEKYCVEPASLDNSTNLTMTSSMLFEDSEEMTTTLSPLLTDDDYSVTLGIFNATLAGLNGTTQAMAEEETGEEEFECEDGLVPQERDECHLNIYDTTLKQIRLLGEIILFVWSIVYLAIAGKEWSFLGTKIFLHTMSLSQSRIFFLIACILLILMVPLRLSCQLVLEDAVSVFVMLFTGSHFLFFCRGFQKTGPFVTMVYRMVANDLLRFILIYSIFVFGFAQSFYIIYQSYEFEEEGESHPMDSAVESVLKVFIMSLGIFGDLWEQLDNTNHALAGKICCFVFLSIAYILLVNLLIAMMGDTYTRIAAIKNEWMRQWARIVLIVERSIPPAERLRQQNLYSERMATGEKALVMKQTMSDEQIEEIRDIIEMKVSHRKNIKRRKEKFGHESNSLIGLDMANASVIAPDVLEEEDLFEQ